MMAATHNYGKFLLSLLNKEVDYLADDIYVAVVDNGYSANQDTDGYWSDVVAHELVGTGYVANGQLLTGKTMVYDESTNQVTLGCDDPAWDPTTWVSVRYLVFYDRTPATDATRPLIAYTDFGIDQETFEQPFTVLIGSSGFCQGSVT